MPAGEVEKLRSEFGAEVPDVLYRGRGCRNCQGTGYRGRQGVFEMMPISDEIRALILERASSREVRRMAVKQGMSSLREDGWRLIREGKTTPEEVLRMTKDEDLVIGATTAHDSALSSQH
jgi:type II secretory ATPase GspE/PulE/Tfp pilus assembly ATPase PilB-like protein